MNDQRPMENSETKCPTCGSICKIGGEAETHFFIPVETNEKALKIFNTITSNGMREMTVDRFIQAINEFPAQQSKEKDEEIKRLNRKKAAHQMFVGKMAGEIGEDRVTKILQECYDALNQ